MGHQRLGKLPAHRLLPEIIRYLVDGGTPTEALVDQITEFGRDALKFALKDDVFIEALWLLIRLPQAASAQNVPAALAEIGIADGLPISVSGALVVMIEQSKESSEGCIQARPTWEKLHAVPDWLHSERQFRKGSHHFGSRHRLMSRHQLHR